MLNNGLFEELNGCVSTGKEANVYQARTAEGTDLAVKIYKTSVLTFKTRDRWRLHLLIDLHSLDSRDVLCVLQT